MTNVQRAIDNNEKVSLSSHLNFFYNLLAKGNDMDAELQGKVFQALVAAAHAKGGASPEQLVSNKEGTYWLTWSVVCGDRPRI